MTNQASTRIHTFLVEVWGPSPHTYDTNEEFDAANQAVVDNIDTGTIKHDVDMKLPKGYYTVLGR